MFKIKKLHLKISILLAFMLVMNICNVCLANPLEPTSDSSVQVISKDSWVLEFYPNYIARNTYSNACKR